jgi:hypothetical protein
MRHAERGALLAIAFSVAACGGGDRNRPRTINPIWGPAAAQATIVAGCITARGDYAGRFCNCALRKLEHDDSWKQVQTLYGGDQSDLVGLGETLPDDAGVQLACSIPGAAAQ